MNKTSFSTSKKISLRDFSSAQKRREFLEKELQIKLDNITHFSFTQDQVTGRNIENLIGATQIPLGAAGPLRIHLEGAKAHLRGVFKDYYIPLATTEGALVASVSRGCKAINEAGGTTVLIEDVGQTRGPVFHTKGILHSQQIKTWIEKNFKQLKKVTDSTSSRLKLLDILVSFEGKNLYARFGYSTSDAMGMNMVTIATQQAAYLIEKETKAQCIALAGNYDIDKKPAWLNFIKGRGKKAWAEVEIDKKIVKEVLKTTPQEIVQVVKSKTHLGSIMSGSLGFNSHFANIIAAIFASCGQDLAHVVEGSLGLTDAEILDNGDLYFSIYLPSLQLGTVGGGTHLPTQQEALKIMKVTNVLEFAQVTAGAVLAGELSLIASLAQGTLAKAHKKLGRNIKDL